MPHTERTKGLIRELLTKLDSTDIYAAKREAAINAKKSPFPGKSDTEGYNICMDIAVAYSNFISDSTLVYLDEAIKIARKISSDSLLAKAELMRSRILATTGYYTEAKGLNAKHPWINFTRSA